MTHRWNAPGLRGVLAIAAAALLLAACGPEEPIGEPPADPTETDPSPEPTDDDREAEAGMEVTGTFTGDPQLEGGCTWLDADDGTRYEVMWPEGYEVTWDPLELRDPDGQLLAADGDVVRVTGSVAGDVASICMVGTIFQARTVEPG